ncbi:UvrD-helicase domain-containing protein [Streptosporangium lutulentum]|uniref:Superfamily I DNA/RNA helicase n=1 Tax=Streptosporangium lutulentum TaxID=1461250 RepID=A0ABT9Q9L5_9ACTN|nr:UvrD-helicase domain-containing protein [Streptosporangium lutulentum]MDP9843352.1 superfamily I DNA/RNA helicase [Streptosporangium lutulentum]
MAPTPTLEQQSIIDAARDGNTITVQAGAGCGKSSTLVATAKEMPKERILCVVYNASVRRELMEKMPSNVDVHTNHSYARRIVANHWRHHLDRMGGSTVNGVQIPRRQTSKQQANILGLSGSAWINGDVKLSAAQQASLAMASIDAWCKTADLELGPEHIKAPANINDPQDIARLQELILPITEKARADIRSKDGKLIWTHDYYLKIAQIVVARANLTLPYRLIMVDECQDTNGAAESLYLGTQSSTQRIIVGDSAQAINGWNGSIDILNTFPADKVLTLTKSFRFGPAIAEEANKWLQLLDAPIRLQGHPPVGSTIGPVDRPDVVLTRTNAASMAEVFAILKAGGSPALVGGGEEIARMAEAAVLLQAGQLTDHPDLCAFADWADVQEYVDTDSRGNDLRAFVELVDNYDAETVNRAAKQVKNASKARPGDTIISTAHKSKGLEWANVRAGGDFRQPNDNTRTPGRLPVEKDELMLDYVTVTRAMKRLDRGSLAWIDNYV